MKAGLLPDLGSQREKQMLAWGAAAKSTVTLQRRVLDD
ncbi:hypothetical protein CSC43_7159 [Pseudomonas aeruginosa]|uniref:Uncharacterized protein n=1 Tax=Pseudomonas paraeruginosa TaxID=2994495 RepID=A0A2R3J5J9_9PSED|nr:hypothetical protein CSB93_6900 [Pseudomonas paraeruginosa]AWE95934.1 hypothetical protein CSC28_6986 [Pseudomonas paraeruginosa]RCH25477.1 hypothetical protein CSC43_7159 [Pseudomonas aeruginosa]